MQSGFLAPLVASGALFGVSTWYGKRLQEAEKRLLENQDYKQTAIINVDTKGCQIVKVSKLTQVLTSSFVPEEVVRMREDDTYAREIQLRQVNKIREKSVPLKSFLSNPNFGLSIVSPSFQFDVDQCSFPNCQKDKTQKSASDMNSFLQTRFQTTLENTSNKHLFECEITTLPSTVSLLGETVDKTFYYRRMGTDPKQLAKAEVGSDVPVFGQLLGLVGMCGSLGYGFVNRS